MKKQFSIDKWQDWESIRYQKLIFAFFLGFIAAILYNPYISAVESLEIKFFQVSIIGKILISVLPFLNIWALVKWKLKVFIPFMVFSRTVLFFVNLLLLLKMYTVGKWIIYSLLLFPDIILLPYFLYFSLRAESSADINQKVVSSMLLCGILAFIDCKYITPILLEIYR